jgi:hypothetical protein
VSYYCSCYFEVLKCFRTEGAYYRVSTGKQGKSGHPSSPAPKKKLYEYLYFQVLCGMIIGVLLAAP